MQVSSYEASIYLLCGVLRISSGFIAENAPETDKRDLLSELEIMKQLKPHSHVIKLLGCVTESGKLCDETLKETLFSVLKSLSALFNILSFLVFESPR